MNSKEYPKFQRLVGEQRLRTFRAVDHVELPLSLRTDDALLEMVVITNELVR